MAASNTALNCALDSKLTFTLGKEPITFRLIPAGNFLMGARGYINSEPVHRVRITRPFYLGIYPVTQAQFAVWAESLNLDYTTGFGDNPRHPASNMDWTQARQWCEWFNSVIESLPVGYAARLPTEAEWEYACASWCETGTDRVYTEYYTGDGSAALSKAGWYGVSDGSGNNTQPNTRDVGRLVSNQFGLFDMHGNVDEWCLDVYRRNTYRYRADSVRNPVAATGTRDSVLVCFRSIRAKQASKVAVAHPGGERGGTTERARPGSLRRPARRRVLFRGWVSKLQIKQMSQK